MADLTERKCVPCEGGIPAITMTEAKKLHAQTPEWKFIKTEGMDAIQRIFKFKDFVEAMKFVNNVAVLAEKEGHHPNFDIRWNKVTLTLWTHAISGLHDNDFIMAAKIDKIA